MFSRLWNLNVAAVLILIALAWPGMWFFWLRPPEAYSRPATVEAPVIRYVVFDKNANAALSSPLVFSLPSSYGFSSVLKMEWPGTRDAWTVAAPQLPFLEFRRENHPLFDPVARGTDVAALISEKNLPYLPEIPAPDPLASVSNGKPHWQADANLKKMDFKMPYGWRDHLPDAPGFWSVTATVEIDKTGHVRHVFLTDFHTDTVLNIAVVNQLRRGRAAASVCSYFGSVTVARP